MKSKHNELDQRFLLLFKIDAKNLLERIVRRKKQYVEVFALKRTRRHFKEVFFNRFQKATISDLAHCPVEVIESLDHFYNLVDELYWYLTHTEDMPNTIEDEIARKASRIEAAFDTLALYIDAELSGENSLSSEQDFYDDREAEELIPMEDDPFAPEEELRYQDAEESDFEDLDDSKDFT